MTRRRSSLHALGPARGPSAGHSSALDRRRLLQGFAALGGLGLAGCATNPVARGLAAPSPWQATDPARHLAALRADPERIFDVSVCLRPFRAAGPRLDVEQLGDKRVVHNYGHGGSGWSLSWGSSTIAVQKALAGSPARVAVLGCGPLGLTSALLAQSAGAQVTVYARELISEVASIRATGAFTPDSRIALADAVDPGFPALWEEMARTSLQRFGRLLGLPGEPVRWIDRYVLNDIDPGQAPAVAAPDPEALHFAGYGARLRDAFPREETLDPAATPFRGVRVRRQANLMFNLSSYAHLLMTQYRAAGGKVERRAFGDLSQLAELPESVIINCTGYGARQLWQDTSLTPVRGQIAWLIPQPEFDYGLLYRGIAVFPRTDGIVVQVVAGGDMRGYGQDHLTPDRGEAEDSVRTLAALYARGGNEARTLSGAYAPGPSIRAPASPLARYRA